MKGLSRSSVLPRLLAAVVACAVASAEAQTMLELKGVSAGFNARSAALAEAYTAEAFDASALYWNPAALPFLHRMYILVDYARDIDNRTYHYSFAAPVQTTDLSALAIGGTAYGWTYLRQSGETERVREYSVDLAAAHRISYALSLGMGARLHFAEAQNTQFLTGLSSFGVFYSPSPEISYALVYQGVRLGSSLRGDSNETESVGWEPVPQRLSLGMALRYPSARDERTISLSVSNEKQIGVRGLYYKAGLEVLPWQFLAVRLGYLSGPDTESLRYGMGIMVPSLQLAYAYIPYGVRGRYHQLSLLVYVWE